MGQPNKFTLRYLFGRNLQHLTALQIRYLKPVKFQYYYKFAVVRNPWERMLSEYRWRSSWDKATKEMSFSDFVKLLPSFREAGDPHFKQAYQFVFNKNGKLLIDYVGKFEQIEISLAQIAKDLNITSEFGKINVSAPKKANQTASFYDNDTALIVEKLFAKDIQTFDYQFPAATQL
jgi:hypothetical protein